VGDDAAVPAAGSPPRIAVALAGDPTDPSSWSGTPAGLCSGLVAAGVELVPVDVRFPAEARLMRLARMQWTAAATNPLIAAANGAWGSFGARRGAPLDGLIAIGSGYLLRGAVPTATYDDLTVAQGMRQPWSDVSRLGPRAAGRWRRRQGRIYRRCGACCVGSAWAGESVREDYGIEPGKVHVVGHGRNFEPRRSERDWSTPRFLFVGVEWERKNGPAVLAAFADLRSRHPGATLDVVGGHPPLDAAGVSGHGRLSLSSAVDREKLEGLFQRSTCLVLPSAFEAFGIAYVDAGAAGMPSIGTTEGGARDAIGDGGLLVAPEDPDALAAAMERLADPGTARELGQRAFAHSALFTWQAVAERVLGALAIPGFDPAPTQLS
jgi:glycosyltransferase involved in cell wall biosynthesis